MILKSKNCERTSSRAENLIAFLEFQKLSRWFYDNIVSFKDPLGPIFEPNSENWELKFQLRARKFYGSNFKGSMLTSPSLKKEWKFEPSSNSAAKLNPRKRARTKIETWPFPSIFFQESAGDRGQLWRVQGGARISRPPQEAGGTGQEEPGRVGWRRGEKVSTTLPEKEVQHDVTNGMNAISHTFSSLRKKRTMWCFPSIKTGSINVKIHRLNHECIQ